MAHPFEDDGSGLSCDRCNRLKRHPEHNVAPTPIDLATRPEHRDGTTYDPTLDGARLTGQAKRVAEVLADGRWHSLREIADGADTPEGTVGSRIRDLRKPKFGEHTIVTRRHESLPGVFEYRMVVRQPANT